MIIDTRNRNFFLGWPVAAWSRRDRCRADAMTAWTPPSSKCTHNSHPVDFGTSVPVGRTHVGHDPPKSCSRGRFCAVWSGSEEPRRAAETVAAARVCFGATPVGSRSRLAAFRRSCSWMKLTPSTLSSRRAGTTHIGLFLLSFLQTT